MPAGRETVRGNGCVSALLPAAVGQGLVRGPGRFGDVLEEANAEVRPSVPQSPSKHVHVGTAGAEDGSF